MILSTTVPATAQNSWPYWWKTSGMNVALKPGDTKHVFFTLAPEKMEMASNKLSVGDIIQYGGKSITITEVYKAGFNFSKAGYPQGNVKADTVGIFYKSDANDVYTLQAQAVANVLGVRLQDSIAAETAILPLPMEAKKPDAITVTPVGAGLPDTINQLTQLLVVGGLVVIGFLAFKKFAR